MLYEVITRATLAALFVSLYRDQPILAMPYRLIAALSYNFV